MIKAFEEALDVQTVQFLDASDEEIASFIGDLLKQISILMQFTGIPADRRRILQCAMDTIEKSLDKRPLQSPLC